MTLIKICKFWKIKKFLKISKRFFDFLNFNFRVEKNENVKKSVSEQLDDIDKNILRNLREEDNLNQVNKDFENAVDYRKKKLRVF